MIVKMDVVGDEIITVNTETGEIAGKTYNAKDWIKRNFDAKWDREKKVWIAAPEVIKQELENTKYYEKYIVNDSNGREEAGKKENTDKVIDEELVNGYEGFYVIRTYESGKKEKRFIG